MRPFEARFHSTCATCEEHISPGDLARYVDDEVVHNECTDKPEPRVGPICPRCWLAKPCDCEEN